jgi:eukaryotic-like serine/threonine-protein kinase
LTSGKLHIADELAERLLGYPVSEWDTLADQWTDGDRQLKDRVMKLAEQSLNARDFVEGLQKKIFTLTQSSLKDRFSNSIEIEGYKIIRRLGTGSSAAVFLAENSEGKSFALKLLRGILSDSLAEQRFHSEIHILASLNHPYIARLVEAGTAKRGEPYVVMEYVDGTPIDLWCDKKRLTVRQRLGLFRKVCEAVHFAHQNLVVHRDLKPEHVLITNSGEVKLIDFGIAKLLEPSIAEIATIATRTGMRVMTPEFASPEQVRGEPVSTSSDIYSLGVLLYLIITGRKPYEFKTTSMLEIERIVCGREPLKPSDAINDGGAGTKGKAANDTSAKADSGRMRNVSFSRLRRQLKGDLDRIVLKAMRKEPALRYGSAMELAADLDNFLRGEPVTARAPTLIYRARKFVQRNKLSMAAACVAVIALVGGVIGTLWQANQAKLNAERAEVQAQLAGQVTDFLIELFESADPNIARGESITVEALLERGTQRALDTGWESSLQANLLGVLGRVYGGMGLYDQSVELYQTALEIAGKQYPPDLLYIADLQSRKALNLRIMGNLTAADSLFFQALENRRSVLGDEHKLTIRSLDDWVGIHAYINRDADLADSLFQEVVNRRRAAMDTDNEEFAEALNNLAYIKMLKREYHQAAMHYEESAEIYRQVSGENHPDRLRAMSSLAVAYHRLGNYGRSEQIHQRLIESRIRVLGENHPQVAVSYHHYAELLKDTGRIEQALRVIQQADEIMQNLSAPHQFYPDIIFSLAELTSRNNDPEAASRAYIRSAQVCAEVRGVLSAGCSRIYQTAGEFLISNGHNSDAIEYLQRAIDVLSPRLQPGHEQLEKLTALIESAR